MATVSLSHAKRTYSRRVSPADGLALLVQPQSVSPVLLIHRDLLNPAQEGNGGAIDVA